jgi:4-amino-4-deoxy-L-arabinose transferase-like glycosyltransferase
VAVSIDANAGDAPRATGFRSTCLSVWAYASRPLVILIAALLISLAVKIIRLNSRDLWLDETYSAYLAGLSFSNCFKYIVGDVHPPLYYFLLWVWVRLFGNAQPALRLLSVVLSGLGTVGIFVAAKAWMGARAGAFAALLFAFSPLLFVYSLEVRMYMLAICLMTALLALHKSVACESTISSRTLTWRVALYAVFSALLFYTHYAGVFFLTALFADWLFACVLRAVRLRPFLLAVALTAVLTGPWIPVMLHQRARRIDLNDQRTASMHDPSSLLFGATEENEGLKDALSRVARNAAAVAGFFPGPPAVLAALCAAPLAAILLGIGWLVIRGDRLCRLGIFTSAGLGACLFFLGHNNSRYMLPGLPVLFLLMGRVVQWGRETRWPVASPAVAFLVVVVYVLGFARQAGVQHPQPWRNLVKVLDREARPGDIILFSAPYAQTPFDYFAGQAGAVHLREEGFPESIYTWWERQPFKGWGSPIAHASDLDATQSRLIGKSGSETIWLVVFETNYYDPKNALLSRLSASMNAREVVLPPEPASAIPGDQPRLIRIRAGRQAE